jgi:hypothetical protein
MTGANHNTPPRRPQENEPTGKPARDALDVIDETVAQITDAEIGEHLRRVLTQAGYRPGHTAEASPPEQAETRPAVSSVRPLIARSGARETARSSPPAATTGAREEHVLVPECDFGRYLMDGVRTDQIGLRVQATPLVGHSKGCLPAEPRQHERPEYGRDASESARTPPAAATIGARDEHLLTVECDHEQRIMDEADAEKLPDDMKRLMVRAHRQNGHPPWCGPVPQQTAADGTTGPGLRKG